MPCTMNSRGSTILASSVTRRRDPKERWKFRQQESPMKSGRSVFMVAIFIMATVLVFPWHLRDAEALRGGRALEGPRGGEAVEGPRGDAAMEGPRGNVAVGTRYTVLPDSAQSVIVGDRTYYVDDSNVYYLPCDDDDSVFCVVPPPGMTESGIRAGKENPLALRFPLLLTVHTPVIRPCREPPS